jgi:hypothetical protein
MGKKFEIINSKKRLTMLNEFTQKFLLSGEKSKKRVTIMMILKLPIDYSHLIK